MRLVKRIIATLVLVCRYQQTRELLLGWKTKKFCAEHWVGYGGKQEPGETLVQCAKRELFAECGISAGYMAKCAILTFHNLDETGEEVIVEVHTYFAEHWRGEPEEKEQAIITPTWYPIGNLPEKIPLADKEWLPRVLAGELLLGEVWYKQGSVDVYARPPIWKTVSAFPQ